MSRKDTYIGSVGDVSGSTIRVRLSKESLTGFVYIEGHGYRCGQIGSFVRIPVGMVGLYGIISQVGATSSPNNAGVDSSDNERWMTLQLVGEVRGGGVLQRGLSQYPTVGDEVHLVAESELSSIYGRMGVKSLVKVGHISNSDAIPALVDLNKLVTRHSAVVGTTGSGKSTTVAGLICSLSDVSEYPSSRILVLDVHGEYGNTVKGRANVFRLGSGGESDDERQLNIPFWALTSDEICEICFGGFSSDKDKNIVLEEIYKSKRLALSKNGINEVGSNELTIDTPVPFSIHAIWLDLYKRTFATYYKSHGGDPLDNLAYADDEDGNPMDGDALRGVQPIFKPVKNEKDDPEKINWLPNALSIGKQLMHLGSLIRMPRYDFILKPGVWLPDMEGQVGHDLDELLDQWLCGEKPVTVLDLSGVPVDILNTIVGVLLRLIYESLFWSRNLSQGGRNRPLLMVMEEAHLYLNPKEDGGQAAKIVRRIVKEGRKYGIGAMIVSQRPSEVDSTILSQCGTFFSLRLANSTDRSHIASALPDNLEGITETLPTLRTGEAIILGESVGLPMRAQITPPPDDRRPDSIDPIVYDCADVELSTVPGGWGVTIETNRNYSEVLEVWRAKDPRPSRLITGENAMERQSVSSSNISSIGFDESSSTLEVEFHSGGVYQYFDVPAQVYEGLMSASSHGSYLANNIKGVYRYSRV